MIFKICDSNKLLESKDFKKLYDLRDSGILKLLYDMCLCNSATYDISTIDKAPKVTNSLLS